MGKQYDIRIKEKAMRGATKKMSTRYSKTPGRAISDTHRDAIAIPKISKPLAGQLQFDWKPDINPDWPEPSTKQFDADEESTKCSNT